MEESLIGILAPLGEAALKKLLSGKKPKGNDVLLIVTLQMSRDISSMRETVGALNGAIHDLKQATNDLRIQVAELKGRMA